jgi:lipopolysaccharide export LptBFGC system permease protein LptF
MRTLGTHVDVEEIQTTKSEKLLAVVLAGFLLVGGIWAYQKVDDTIRAAVEPPAAAAADRAAVDRLEAARERLFEAEEAERRALEEMEVARETYRTALDADQPAGTLERAYEDAQARHEQAQAASVSARDEVTDATPAAEAAQERIQAEERRTARLESLGSFGLRLLMVIATLASAYALLGRLRTAGSRYLPVGLAAVGFAAILALVMASDYVSDYVDPLEFGPLVLAAVGAGLTMVAFVALQRYLEKRIPLRRVRKGECPFCGFPGRGESHCEGCGRALLAECPACAEPRRVGALHCGVCGSA